MKQHSTKKEHPSQGLLNAVFIFSVIIAALACCIYFYLHWSKETEALESIEVQENGGDEAVLKLFSAEEMARFDGISEFFDNYDYFY